MWKRTGTMAKIRKIEFVCKDCGKVAQPDKSLSTGPWGVIPPKCVHCGGGYRIKVT
jgi:DNA replicative helicase MCM subunit Mcm2 (Cdc46/Mcm family)